MKIIPENEVDKAAINEADNWGYRFGDCAEEYYNCEAFNSFKAGVEFAESKFEELSVEFMEWLLPKFNSLDERKQLFKQFLKERNDG